MPERCVDRHRRRDLEDREAAAPGEELGDVEGLAAAQSDDRAAVRQLLDGALQLVEVEGLDEVDAGEGVPPASAASKRGHRSAIVTTR